VTIYFLLWAGSIGETVPRRRPSYEHILRKTNIYTYETVKTAVFVGLMLHFAIKELAPVFEDIIRLFHWP